MLDPKFMDEQLGIDRTKLNERYKQVGEEEIKPQAPKRVAPNFEVAESYGNDMTEEDFYDREAQDVQESFQPEPDVIPDNVKKQQQRPPKLSRPGKAFAQDNEIAPGGPRESQILAWKKQFGRVYMTELEGECFVWRRINRFEYKEVMSVPNTNELSREEMICEVCVLYPYEYSYETMVNDAGGLPSMIAEQIMQKSGFTRKARVVAL